MPNAFTLVITNASAIAPFLLWQVKFDSFSLTFVLVGYLLLNAASLLGPFIMTRFKIKVRHVGIVAIANLCVVVLFGVSNELWLVAAAFFAHVLLHVIQTVLVSGLFHAGIENSIRATAGSIISLFDSLVVVGLAPLVGWIGQTYGLGWGISISCLLYATVIVIAFTGGFRTRVARSQANDAESEATP
ncbi:MAG: hypothetical protein ABJB03_02960 [Rhodoglobus sp.]